VVWQSRRRVTAEIRQDRKGRSLSVRLDPNSLNAYGSLIRKETNGDVSAIAESVGHDQPGDLGSREDTDCNCSLQPARTAHCALEI